MGAGPLTLSANSNGSYVSFNPARVVGETAIITDQSNPGQGVYTGTTRVFSTKVTATNAGASPEEITLSGAPHADWGTCRVWYFYNYEFGAPIGYKIAPRTVAEGLFTEIQALFISEEEVVAGYVPYTGANANVDLGAYNLTTAALVVDHIAEKTTDHNIVFDNQVDIGSIAIPDDMGLTVAQTDRSAFFAANAPTTDLTGRAFITSVNGDTWWRTVFYSDGRVGFGSGSATRDVFLSRSSANTLKIAGSFDGTAAGNLTVTNIITGGIGIFTTIGGNLIPAIHDTFTLGGNLTRWSNIWGTIVTGGTLTDGTLSIASGSITSAVNGTFSGTVGAANLTASVDVTAGNNFFASNGTVGSPSYSFTSDTISGIYYLTSGTGILNFATGGVKRAAISSAGLNMQSLDIAGVGTITATTLTDGTLSISSGVITSAIDNADTDNDSALIKLSQAGAGDVGVKLSVAARNWIIDVDNSQDDKLIFKTSTNETYPPTGAMWIDPLGNLKINGPGATGGGNFATASKVNSDSIVDLYTASLSRGAGNGDVGLGLGFLYELENDAGSLADAGKFEVVWTDASDGAEQSSFTIKTVDGGAFVSPIKAIGGITQIGDGGVTNYSTFAADGILTMTGTARVKKLLEFSDDQGTGANSPTARVAEAPYLSYTYVVNDDSHFTFEVPHGWASGTDLIVHVHWYTSVDQTDDEVNWQLGWLATPIGGGEAVNVGPVDTDTSGDINCPTQWHTTDTTAGTIEGALLTADDLIGFDITRIAIVDGTNPQVNTIHVLSVEIEYTADKLGEAL